MAFFRRFAIVVGIVLVSLLAIYFNVILMRAVEPDRWAEAPSPPKSPSHAEAHAPTTKPAEMTPHEYQKFVSDFTHCLSARVRTDIDATLRRSGLIVQLLVHPKNDAAPTHAVVTTSSGNVGFDQIVHAAAVQCIEPYEQRLAGRSIPVKYELP